MYLREPNPAGFLRTALVLIVIGALAGGCSTSDKITSLPKSFETSSPPGYTLVYVIHGDANYLYHQDGKPIRADQNALNKAFNVAVKATKGEVFIFHQKPEKHAFLFFPKKDRTYFHYRNGQLIGYGEYSPSDGGLTEEASIFNEKAFKENSRTFFFYFGHEIPMHSDLSYHRSQPDVLFNAEIFSDDLSLFRRELELTVLSTCNNGNPYMIRLLNGKTKTVIASPQNLHLSYLDSEDILLLNDNPDLSAIELAQSISRDSFQRLSTEVSTTVSISVYDIEKISSELADTLLTNSVAAISPERSESVDCLTLPEYRSSGLQHVNGVFVYYQPPQFGQKTSNKSTKHSGWGCK